MSHDIEGDLRRALHAKAEQVEVSEGRPLRAVPAPARTRALVSLAAAAVVLLGLVGGLLLLTRSDDPDVAPPADAPSTVSAPPAPTTSSAPTTSAPTTTTPDSSGEPIALVTEGTELAVVGVAADDVLNVRVGPGIEFDVAFTLGPLDTVNATGQGWLTSGGAVWAEISQGGRRGWANNAFLLLPGSTDDATASVGPLRGETMEDLALRVADAVVGEAGQPTIVDGPHAGDLAEITVDVTGLANQAAGGYRLHVFAQREPADGLYVLRTVESTALCALADNEGCL